MRGKTTIKNIKPASHALDIHSADEKYLLLCVSTFHVCHPQGAFTSVKVVLSKRAVVRSTVTHLQTALKLFN
jgi:hypothetical protein